MTPTEPKTPTQEDVLALIAATYSERRPDPFSLMPEAQAIVDAFEHGPDPPGMKIVA